MITYERKAELRDLAESACNGDTGDVATVLGLQSEERAYIEGYCAGFAYGVTKASEQLSAVFDRVIGERKLECR